MVWNVQRMGEFSGKTSPIAQQVSCVAQLITQEQPDLFALLEITYTQLQALQQQLKIPQDHCLWSDYYGTGQTRFGGLATCIFSSTNHLAISRRRDLNLPPNWKYLFIEVQHTSNDTTVPLNFLAVHIAPPKVSDRAVAKMLTDLLRGKKSGIQQALSLLQRYEQQVTLQGTQAVNALRRIGNFQDPTIMAGDFNSTQDTALHKRLRQSLNDTWLTAGLGFGTTRYWADFLPLRIDYIYVTPEFAVQDSKTFAYECSDHFPVVSTVFLK
jgi:endonuclease/exonuclease/phosphatase family metal-dependent hydrolase